MDKEKENPPAFPQNGMVNQGADLFKGMTLRDCFAAHCPITLSEFVTGWKEVDSASADEMRDAFVRFRFAYADSMLRARNTE